MIAQELPENLPDFRTDHAFKIAVFIFGEGKHGSKDSLNRYKVFLLVYQLIYTLHDDTHHNDDRSRHC